MLLAQPPVLQSDTNKYPNNYSSGILFVVAGVNSHGAASVV